MAKGRGMVMRYGAFIADHHRTVILAMLIATAIVGGGFIFLEPGVQMAQFEVDSTERDAMNFVEDHFASTNHEVTVVVIQDNESLHPTALTDTLQIQQSIRENASIAPTLADEQSTIGVGNAIAYAADDSLREDERGIPGKIAEIEQHNEEDIIVDLEEAIHTDDVVPGDRPSLSTLLPAEYVPGDPQTDGRLLLVIHDENVEEDDLLAAQLVIDEIVTEELYASDAYVFGEALTFERGATATGESFAIVGPLALLFVLVAMGIAYRDPYDVFLGVFGVGTVLLWLAGFLGWTGIGINQLLIAVPCLLVGLSIDHGFHVVMRYREEAGSGVLPREAMSTALAAVILPIGMTTLTTVIGFLSGMISPIRLLREFGLASAFGIIAAFLVFGAFIPALRVEFSLRGRTTVSQGVDPIGRRPSIARILHIVQYPSRRVPIVVIGIAVLLTLGGVYGLTAVDTTTERTDFLPGEHPDWVEHVPSDLRTSEQTLREEAVFLEETFDRGEDQEVSILINHDPSDPVTFEAIDAGTDAAIAASTLGHRTDGRPIIYSPLAVIEELAQEDQAVADALEQSDSTGDGIPNREIDALYEAAFAADPTAMEEVVYRGGDGASRIVVTVDGDADEALIRWEMQQVVSASTTDEVSVIATGEPILTPFQDRAVVVTAFGTFLIALTVISLLLTFAFRYRHGSWLLGPVTIAPVLVALAWVIGIMAVLNIPYNAETAIITGIAIGIGVDYAIHITERFQLERAAHTPQGAINIAVTSTGGILFASAITTAVGFAALMLTFVPSLQRFGAITALFVVLALVTSLILLPALLLVLAKNDPNDSVTA